MLSYCSLLVLLLRSSNVLLLLLPASMLLIRLFLLPFDFFPRSTPQHTVLSRSTLLLLFVLLLFRRLRRLPFLLLRLLQRRPVLVLMEWLSLLVLLRLVLLPL